MKRKLVLAGLVFLVIFMMLTNVEAQGPVLEFIDAPDRIKLEDAFTFSVKLTDAQGYDYFSLYGITPSGEEMYFGEHIFDEGLWFVYSYEWTLTFSSFNETGYYTLSVDAGSYSWVDTVPKITESCFIYVEEVNTIFIPNGEPIALRFIILGIMVVIGIVVTGVAISKRGKKVETISKDAKVFVICPYCGAKTEQGITKCQKCGADM